MVKKRRIDFVEEPSATECPPGEFGFQVQLRNFSSKFIEKAIRLAEKETERVTLSSSVGKSEVLEKLPPEVENLAREAALALGVEIAGIDLVIDQRDGQARIVEVNQAPEFEVMERRTGKDIAGEILEYLLEKCKE